LFREKSPDVIRLVFENIDGLSQMEDGQIKLEVLWQFTSTQAIYIFAFMESNLCWDLPHHWNGSPIKKEVGGKMLI